MHFVKTDFAFAIILSVGLLTLAWAPAVVDYIGSLLSIQQRLITLVVLINTSSLLAILYLTTLGRNNRGRINELTRKLSVNEAPKTDGGQPTIYIIIPAYNEADTIPSIIHSLPETIRGYKITPLVVSDGSADETAQRANVGDAIVVEHAINQGQGGALQTGFEIAESNGADIVVTMDADGQHPVEELTQIISPIINGEAEYVMGSRHLGTDDSDNSIVRQSGIQTFTMLINVLTKANITDCTNGYRAIHGEYLPEMTLTEERFSAPELIIEARKQGLRIKEVPITIEAREEGESKKPQLGYAFGLFRTIMTTWIR